MRLCLLVAQTSLFPTYNPILPKPLGTNYGHYIIVYLPRKLFREGLVPLVRDTVDVLAGDPLDTINTISSTSEKLV